RSAVGIAVPQYFADLQKNYCPSIVDMRLIFTAIFVWEVPWLRAQQGFTGHVLGGWQVSGIQTFQTGLPFTALIGNAACSAGAGANCVDPSGSGCFGASPAGCRVNQIGDPNSGAAEQLNNWFNAAAFAVPTATQNTLPTERPGAIRGPGFWNTDLSLFKNIRFTEQFGAQLRLETFNTFNHTTPVLSQGTSTSGNLSFAVS